MIMSEKKMGNFDFEMDNKETETMTMTMLVKIQDYRPQTRTQNHPPKNPKEASQVALITQPPSFLFLVPSPWWLCHDLVIILAPLCIPGVSMKKGAEAIDHTLVVPHGRCPGG
jgi:hypothetical protein